MKIALCEMISLDVKSMNIRESKADIVKAAFSAALEDLMLKKDLEEISVNEISDRAGMSRTTFYRYFQDKYELSRWRLENILGDSNRPDVNLDIVSANLEMMVCEIGKHKPYYKKLFSYAGQNSLDEFFYSVLFEWSKHLGRKAVVHRDTYMIQYNASGITGLMKRWLNENNPIAPEDINRLLSGLLPQ